MRPLSVQCSSRLLKKDSYASLRSIASLNVPAKYASARRFFARLASEIFLSSLQFGFFSNLLVARFLTCLFHR